jgi:hypothetical protein
MKPEYALIILRNGLRLPCSDVSRTPFTSVLWRKLLACCPRALLQRDCGAQRQSKIVVRAECFTDARPTRHDAKAKARFCTRVCNFANFGESQKYHRASLNLA